MTIEYDGFTNIDWSSIMANIRIPESTYWSNESVYRGNTTDASAGRQRPIHRRRNTGIDDVARRMAESSAAKTSNGTFKLVTGFTRIKKVMADNVSITERSDCIYVQVKGNAYRLAKLAHRTEWSYKGRMKSLESRGIGRNHLKAHNKHSNAKTTRMEWDANKQTYSMYQIRPVEGTEEWSRVAPMRKLRIRR